MKTILSIACFFYCILLSNVAFAQDQIERELKPETGMRADGKIYVVAAVLLIILSGLFIYLVSLDRKISRLEKGRND